MHAESNLGLNDCVAGVHWLSKRAAEFGINPAKIIIAGESGGGNLSIATALRLKASGHGQLLNGLFALCPYILGNYPDPLYPSTLENNGIFLHLDAFGAHAYGVEAYRQRDPCAWPGFATCEDLKGLPRVYVSLNECDPLRDEGMAFYRKCVQAGVPAQCRVVAGTAHGAELFGVLPEVSRMTAQTIAAFAWGEDCLRLPPILLGKL